VPDFELETALGARDGRCVVGVDEVGRGPWAGPVVAAAAVICLETLPVELLTLVDDSKKIRPALRLELAAQLRVHCRFGIGVASVAEIDSINILQASFLAMARAVEALGVAPDAALVDGKLKPRLPCPMQAVIEGDGRSLSIAAASIIAKVHRDSLMEGLALRHPGYGWEQNRGYGTPDHRAALARQGPCAEHRRSFRPVSELLLATA